MACVRGVAWCAVLLVVGAFTSLVVAWACSAARAGLQVDPSWAAGRDAKRPTLTAQYGTKSGIVEDEAVLAWAGPMFDRIVVHDSVAARTTTSLRERVWSGCGLTYRHTGATAHFSFAYSIGDVKTFGVCEAGWPWRAWSSRFEVDGGIDSTSSFLSPVTKCSIEGDAGHHFAPPLAGFPYGQAWPTQMGAPLPFIPLWPGLAFNTLFYAVAWWMAVLSLVSIRARFRRKGDRCLSCGYALAGLPKAALCPECGGGSRPQPVLSPPSVSETSTV